MTCLVTPDREDLALTCPCDDCVAGRATFPWWQAKHGLAPWLLSVQTIAGQRLAPASRVLDEIAAIRHEAGSVCWTAENGLMLAMVERGNVVSIERIDYGGLAEHWSES